MSKNFYLFIVTLFLFTACNNAVESPYPDIKFEKIPTMPGNGRSASVAFVVNGKAYVALGRDSHGNPLKDCWEFNPTNNSWLAKDSFPGIARVKAVAVTLNGKVYVGLGFNNLIGVYTDRDAYLKDFWEYDPTTDNWAQKKSFPSFASNACVSFEYKGEIYVGAGFNGYDFTNEFWKYSPESDNWTQLNDIQTIKRAGAVLCKSDDHILFGTGYRTVNENDWWEYRPASDSWKKRKPFPDNGRENAIGISIDNRLFISTGKHFGGSLTTLRFYNNIIEYDATRDAWYKRGYLPAKGRENAISFTINGKGYIGFGDNDKEVFNDLWSFEP